MAEARVGFRLNSAARYIVAPLLSSPLRIVNGMLHDKVQGHSPSGANRLLS